MRMNGARKGSQVYMRVYDMPHNTAHVACLVISVGCLCYCVCTFKNAFALRKKAHLHMRYAVAYGGPHSAGWPLRVCLVVQFVSCRACVRPPLYNTLASTIEHTVWPVSDKTGFKWTAACRSCRRRLRVDFVDTSFISVQSIGRSKQAAISL